MQKDESPDQLPTDLVQEITRLRQEYEVVSQQVKQLIKTESKLYAYQEKLDAQVKEYKKLYELSKNFNLTFDVPKLFEYTIDYVIHQLEYERVLIFLHIENSGVYAVRALDGYYGEREKIKAAELVLREDDPLLAPFLEGAEYLICKADTKQELLAQCRVKLLMDEYLIYPLGPPTRPRALLAVGNSAGNAAFYQRVTDSESALLGVGNLAGLLTSSIENHFFYVSMEKALEQEKRAEAKYRGIFENAAEGILQTAPDGRFLSCNPAAAAILGYASPAELIERVPMITQLYVSPERRGKLYELMRDSGEVKNYEAEFYRKDGSKQWVLISARAVFDKNREILYVDGMILDISERKKAEDELQKAHDELEARVRMRTSELSVANAQLHQRQLETSALYQVSSVINRSIRMDELLSEVLNTLSNLNVFKIDKGIVFIIEGDRMKMTAHVGHSDAFLKLHADMRVGDCLCGIVAQTGEMLVSANSAKDNRHTLADADTPPHGHLIVPLKTKDRVEGVLDLYTPVDAEIDEDKVKLLLSIGNQLGIAIENARLYEKTRALSLRDSLTGLWNHEELLRILGLELARADREGSTVGVIMADLDHFKLINDTYGHMAGDAVLRAASKRMLSLFRSYDAVGRYGGEEFVIILPGCDRKNIMGIAERLRKTIGDARMDTPAGLIPVTMSLGVAVSDTGKRRSVEAHVHAADLALYRAKANGRNRVEFASDDE
jgi:diguanylate cyclase (GGDEF)-like protein/PAS domain S-box-containing protein